MLRRRGQPSRAHAAVVTAEAGLKRRKDPPKSRDESISQAEHALDAATPRAGCLMRTRRNSGGGRDRDLSAVGALGIAERDRIEFAIADGCHAAGWLLDLVTNLAIASMTPVGHGMAVIRARISSVVSRTFPFCNGPQPAFADV